MDSILHDYAADLTDKLIEEAGDALETEGESLAIPFKADDGTLLAD